VNKPVLAAFALIFASGSSLAQTVTPDEARAIAKDAYIGLHPVWLTPA
jgi:hypothetical protein